MTYSKKNIYVNGELVATSTEWKTCKQTRHEWKKASKLKGREYYVIVKLAKKEKINVYKTA